MRRIGRLTLIKSPQQLVKKKWFSFGKKINL